MDSPPFTESEMDDFANRYLFLINPRFIKIAVNSENKVVAFVIAMSHIGDGIQKAKGYLFPFGIFQIFAAARKTNQLNLLLGGIDPDYRGKGLDVMMGVKLMQSAIIKGQNCHRFASRIGIQYQSSGRNGENGRKWSINDSGYLGKI